jgi:hypothetical protein
VELVTAAGETVRARKDDPDLAMREVSIVPCGLCVSSRPAISRLAHIISFDSNTQTYLPTTPPGVRGSNPAPGRAGRGDGAGDGGGGRLQRLQGQPIYTHPGHRFVGQPPELTTPSTRPQYNSGPASSPSTQSWHTSPRSHTPLTTSSAGGSRSPTPCSSSSPTARPGAFPTPTRTTRRSSAQKRRRRRHWHGAWAPGSDPSAPCWGSCRHVDWLVDCGHCGGGGSEAVDREPEPLN